MAFWKTVRFQLTVTLIGLAIIPLLIGLVFARQFNLVQEAEIIALQHESARRIAVELSTFLEKTDQDMSRLLTVYDLSALEPDAQERLLEKLQNVNNIFDHLAVLDNTGQEVVHVSRLRVLLENNLKNQADQPFFQEPMRTGLLYLGPLYFSDITYEPLMDIGYPIIDLRTGKLNNVLAATIRVKVIWDLIQRVDIREGENVYIVDDRNRIIAHRDPSVVISNAEKIVSIVEGVETGLNGNSVVQSFESFRFGNQTFKVVVERDTDIAFARSRQTIKLTFLVAMVALIAALGGAYLVARRIINPIRTLTSVAQAIQTGDFSQRVKLNSEDEFNILATTFNSMAAQVEESITGLEEQVELRTRKLNTVAELSHQLNSILDVDKLLAELLKQLQETFNYYHAHIYLVNPVTGKLDMAQGLGEVGHTLKEKKHTLSPAQGIVGWVATTNRYLLSEDVTESTQFVRNLLLPNTKSELAVPLYTEGQMIGVLDVQSDQLNYFTQADISMLESITNHAAVAIQNARLLANQKETIVQLEELDRAKSHFITMMSHELRTPLQAINGFTELLLMGLNGDLPKPVFDDIQLIHNNGKHLLRLIDDILDITQIEAGQLEVNFEKIDSQSVIKEALTETQSLVNDKPIQMQFAASDNPIFIQADPTRFKQILLNLLSNAIKFTYEGHVIVEINETCSLPNQVEFRVIDTGVGIPVEAQQAIFELFQQVDMTDSRKYGGLGVGLSICKLLVDKHGGTLGVKSKDGVGSEFWFTMPVPPENSEEG